MVQAEHITTQDNLAVQVVVQVEMVRILITLEVQLNQHNQEIQVITDMVM